MLGKARSIIDKLMDDEKDILKMIQTRNEIKHTKYRLNSSQHQAIVLAKNDYDWNREDGMVNQRGISERH